ncbi:MAG: ATP synthase F1 subunit delta [Acidobacteria bacterium]|nr:ATP synthase F1 subunit delta [Acidobacteriota bacterium]
MSTRASSLRYARALFDVAQAESDLMKVDADLAAVAKAVCNHAELTRVMTSRTVPDATRRRIVVAVAESLGAPAPVVKLVALLADRRRLALLPEIAERFSARLLAHRNVVPAQVVTAVPLAPPAAAAIEQGLSRATGKTVAMQFSVDPALLGGVRATVGGTVYDGSVRTQLKKMRDHLVAQG